MRMDKNICIILLMLSVVSANNVSSPDMAEDCKKNKNNSIPYLFCQNKTAYSCCLVCIENTARRFQVATLPSFPEFGNCTSIRQENLQLPETLIMQFNFKFGRPNSLTRAIEDKLFRKNDDNNLLCKASRRGIFSKKYCTISRPSPCCHFMNHEKCSSTFPGTNTSLLSDHIASSQLVLVASYYRRKNTHFSIVGRICTKGSSTTTKPTTTAGSETTTDESTKEVNSSISTYTGATNTIMDNTLSTFQKKLQGSLDVLDEISEAEPYLSALPNEKYISDNKSSVSYELAVVEHYLKNNLSIHFGRSSIISIEADLNEIVIKVVALQIMIPEEQHQKKISTYPSTNNHLTTARTSLFPLTDVPVLSISAFSVTNSTKLDNINVAFRLNIMDYHGTVHKHLKSNTGLKILKQITYVCGYYNVNESTYSVQGCVKQDQDGTIVLCYCNHTTVFAVLLSVESIAIPQPVLIISYATESISEICLLITFVILMQVRSRINNDRIIIQINLTVSLFFLHFFNLFHDLALGNSITCEMIAVLLHFFTVSTAAWMFNEGLSLFLMTTDQTLKIASNPKFFSRLRLLIGWGVPFVIVLAFAVIGMKTKTYMSEITAIGYTRCWLSTKYRTIIWAAIIPVGLLLIFNCIFGCKIASFIYKMSKQTDQLKPLHQQDSNNLVHLKASLRGFFLLFPALGIPWLFSFLSGFSSTEANIIFMYINVLLNGLQGFFILLVYVVLGSEVKKTFLRQASKRFPSLKKAKNGNSTTMNLQPATKFTTAAN